MSDITKWQNNTYVPLSELHDDHEIALVENSLRDSEFNAASFNYVIPRSSDVLGVFDGDAGYWVPVFEDQLITRTQALKLSGVKL
tara:strand:+ start:311 stop:565 length:255 start_codon:yes stop_codon:yes gene_type:complete